MDRDLVLAGLMVSTVGVTLLASGAWTRRIEPAANACQWERVSWRALWWPMIPTVVIASILLGWAIMEPAESDEHLPSSAVLVSAVFIGLWLRAALRAHRALQSQTTYLAGTVGLWRPRVVLAAELLECVDQRSLQAIEAHEAAHVRHRDPLRIWLAQLVTDLQWPGPGARARFERWRQVLELARDEEARRSGADGADLAAAVLLAARLHVPATAGASLIHSEFGLHERIRRLLAPLPAGGPVPMRTATTFAVFPASVLGVLSGVHFGEGLVQTLVRWLP